MKKLRLLLAFCALLLGWSNASAQGTWTEPSVPGIDPSTAEAGTTYYLYNVGSDAFVTYGMQWGSMATARRLSYGDQAASGIHKLKVSTHNGKLRFHLLDNKYDDRFLSDNGGEFGCYVDTWQGENNDNANIDFSYSAGSVSGAYTLTNAGTSNKLDVHWLYGGQLTGVGGQGFTDWAIIPESSITDGSYAKYKEKKQMYGVYQALVAAGVVASYTTELETANSVYVNASSTVSQLRTATRTLINAAAEDIASSINGNSLFDDADMWGNQALSTWTSTAPSNNDGGEYETYNIKYDFNQTHDVPNGLYKIVFHSLFRNDGSGAAPRIIVTDGELDGGGTTASANVPLFTSLSFLPVNTAGASGNIKDGAENRGGFYADWNDNGGVVIPNGRRSSADAMAHTNAVASVDNFKVTTGKMNIRMIIDQNSQWVNFQGFDIIFYGSTTGKLYRDLVALLETADGLKDQVMKADKLSALTDAISSYSSLTKSSSEAELETAIDALTTAIEDAEASIDAYAKANATLAVMKATIDGTNVYTSSAYTTYNGSYTSYKGKYDARNLTNEEAATLYNDVLPLTRVANSGWHKANTTDDFLLSVWSVNGEQCVDFDKALYINTWSTEGDSDGSGFQAPFFEYWTSAASLEAKKLSATVTGLTANTAYDVSALVRVSGNSKVAGSITLTVNGGAPVDVTAGDAIGTTGRYMKTFTATGVTDASGNLEISFDVAANSNISWFTFKDVKYAVGEAETTNDYTALNAAIEGAETMTLGFANGEYAPYKNVDALEILTEAKAIDQSKSSISSYVSAVTSALSGATWTANVGEVNAVYNGDFALSDNDGVMAGWTTDNAAGLGGALHACAFVLTSGMTNYDKLAAFGQGDATRSCAYFRFDGTNSARTTKYTYGTTNGYTMPLKAGVVYKLTAQAGGWGQADKNFQIAVVSSTDANVVAQNLKTPATGVNAGGSVIDYEMVFEVPENGNYKLVLTNPNDVDNAVVVSNIELKSAAPVSKSISSAGWATYCSPYALDLANATGLTDAYIVTGATGSVLNTTSVKGGTIPANTGILIEAPEGTVTIPVVAGSETNVDDNELVGVLENTEITAEAGYVLMGSPKVGFYQNEKDFTVGANTAYLPVTFAGSARAAYFFRGDITGVDNVEAAAEATLKDGKYLENGKIVIVKNGQKFNAAGAQMK